MSSLHVIRWSSWDRFADKNGPIYTRRLHAEALIIPSILFLKENEVPAFPMGICRFSIGEQKATEVIADFEQALSISQI